MPHFWRSGSGSNNDQNSSKNSTNKFECRTVKENIPPHTTSQDSVNSSKDVVKHFNKSTPNADSSISSSNKGSTSVKSVAFPDLDSKSVHFSSSEVARSNTNQMSSKVTIDTKPILHSVKVISDKIVEETILKPVVAVKSVQGLPKQDISEKLVNSVSKLKTSQNAIDTELLLKGDMHLKYFLNDISSR